MTPAVYLTIGIVTIVTLLAAVALARGDIVGSYYRAWMVAGFGLLGVVLAQLFLVVETGTDGFQLLVPVTVLGVATVLAVGIWAVVARLTPSISSGTGPVGLVVLWGYTIGGTATLFLTDWSGVVGGGGTAGATNPLAQTVASVTSAVLPSAITEVTGTAWPFLLVQILVALGVVSVLDEDIVETEPLATNLMLAGVLAVGLVPGVRNVLRLTIGL